MNILRLCPGKKAEAITIPHTLEEMQKQVGGYIQAIYPFEDMGSIIMPKKI